MEIRELSDLDDVDILIGIATTYPKTQEQLLAVKKQLLQELSEVGENRKIYVGYENDNPIAMIQLIVENADNDPELADGNKIAHIHNLQVRSNLQNQGIGKKMMTFIENKAKKLGKQVVTLGVDDINVIALHIYKKIGYHTFKTEPGRTKNEKCLLMKKDFK